MKQYSDLAKKILELDQDDDLLPQISDMIAEYDGQCGKLSIDKILSNGITCLSLRDKHNKIVAEWYDVLTKPCAKCGQMMAKYSAYGREYAVCGNCADENANEIGFLEKLWSDTESAQ